MSGTRPTGALDLELLTPGPNAHGYGRLPDGRGFAFRVRHRKARLEIYRPGADGTEPTPQDIVLVAERTVGRSNLESRRSLLILLRGLLETAEPAQELPERTLRGYLGTLDSMIGEPVPDEWRAEPPPRQTAGSRLRGYLHRLFDVA